MHIIPALRSTLLTLGLMSSGISMAITGGSVDKALLGTWVPAQAACTSPLKVVVDANKVTFFNGSQQQAYTKLEQCFSCAGRDVQNVVWLSTDAMGDSPFILQVDTAKKSGVIDFSNDKKLGARFPFGNAPVKRCG